MSFLFLNNDFLVAAAKGFGSPTLIARGFARIMTGFFVYDPILKLCSRLYVCLLTVSISLMRRT